MIYNAMELKLDYLTVIVEVETLANTTVIMPKMPALLALLVSKIVVSSVHIVVAIQ